MRFPFLSLTPWIGSRNIQEEIPSSWIKLIHFRGSWPSLVDGVSTQATVESEGWFGVGVNCSFLWHEYLEQRSAARDSCPNAQPGNVWDPMQCTSWLSVASRFIPHWDVESSQQIAEHADVLTLSGFLLLGLSVGGWSQITPCYAGCDLRLAKYFMNSPFASHSSNGRGKFAHSFSITESRHPGTDAQEQGARWEFSAHGSPLPNIYSAGCIVYMQLN